MGGALDQSEQAGDDEGRPTVTETEARKKVQASLAAKAELTRRATSSQGCKSLHTATLL